jgi:O-antigen/teichoic acid export membrane protein
VTTPVRDARIWGPEDHHLTLMARNVTTRYLAIGVEGLLGLLLLPFNVSHLGPSAYGLWALTASITMYFSVLDLGYGGALVKFIAQYRAWRDQRALNEILSTMFVVFTGVGMVTFLVTLGVASQFSRLFRVTPDQVRTGQTLLLIIGVFVGLRFAISIFGAVVYGFQRFYLNNIISIVSSVCVAVTNVVVLESGAQLEGLVLATTSVRILTLVVFVLSAYAVYPGLHVSTRLFRRARLREVTSFSVYVLVLDWSAKLNYSTDALVIGALMGTSAVALWTAAQRVAQLSLRLTMQLSTSLFPLVVDSDAAARSDRLQLVLMHGTTLSLALAAPICVGLSLLAKPVMTAWMGPTFQGSAVVVQLLLCVALVRVGTSSANVILRGAGHHRLLAFTNTATAVVNLLLSLALIGPLGLNGVAWGTLLPVVTAALFVLFPRACERVGVPVSVVIRRAVWPAVWPAGPFAAIVWAGEPVAQGSLLRLALLLSGASVVYAGLFVGLAISADARRVYRTKLYQLATGGRRQPAAA